MITGEVSKPSYLDGYDIKGKIWYRESTGEWVLEIEGAINDCSFVTRWPVRGDVAPEDVPGLIGMLGAIK